MQPLDISYLYLGDLKYTRREVIDRLQQLGLIDKNFQATGRGVGTRWLTIKTTSVWNDMFQAHVKDDTTILTPEGIIYIPILFEREFYQDDKASANLIKRACLNLLPTIEDLRKQGYLNND